MVKKNTVKEAKQYALRFSFCDFALVCMCLHLHENCSQNCVQFHAKITASIAPLNLHKCTTSAAPLTPSAEESGFVWSQEIRDTQSQKMEVCPMKMAPQLCRRYYCLAARMKLEAHDLVNINQKPMYVSYQGDKRV